MRRRRCRDLASAHWATAGMLVPWHVQLQDEWRWRNRDRLRDLSAGSPEKCWRDSLVELSESSPRDSSAGSPQTCPHDSWAELSEPRLRDSSNRNCLCLDECWPRSHFQCGWLQGHCCPGWPDSHWPAGSRGQRAAGCEAQRSPSKNRFSGCLWLDERPGRCCCLALGGCC